MQALHAASRRCSRCAVDGRPARALALARVNVASSVSRWTCCAGAGGARERTRRGDAGSEAADHRDGSRRPAHPGAALKCRPSARALARPSGCWLLLTRRAGPGPQGERSYLQSTPASRTACGALGHRAARPRCRARSRRRRGRQADLGRIRPHGRASRPTRAAPGVAGCPLNRPGRRWSAATTAPMRSCCCFRLRAGPDAGDRVHAAREVDPTHRGSRKSSAPARRPRWPARPDGAARPRARAAVRLEGAPYPREPTAARAS